MYDSLPWPSPIPFFKGPVAAVEVAYGDPMMQGWYLRKEPDTLASTDEMRERKPDKWMTDSGILLGMEKFKF